MCRSTDHTFKLLRPNTHNSRLNLLIVSLSHCEVYPLAGWYSKAYTITSSYKLLSKNGKIVWSHDKRTKIGVAKQTHMRVGPMIGGGAC